MLSDRRSRATRRTARRILVVVAMFAGLAVNVSAQPAHAVTGGYQPLAPVRVLDTRTGEATIDGQFQGKGIRPFNSTLELGIAGRAGVPAGAAAVVLNVTVVDAQGPGFATVFPCDSPRPTASNLNYVAGQTVPNLVVSRLSSSGTVCIYTLGSTHLLADVSGYFTAGDALTTLAAPVRLLDTRRDSPTVDGQYAGTGALAAGNVQQVAVVGRAGIPSGISSIILNVTAANTAGTGFVTVYPCDASRPTASNLNFVPGQAVPNTVIARVPASGMICLFTSATSDLVADISGYFGTAVPVVPLPTPARLLDTRSGSPTVDGAYMGGGLRPAGGTVQLPVGGRAGVPADATAVILNVTVTEAQASGFVTVFPRGAGRPLASNLNFTTGQTVANAVIMPLGIGASVCLFNNAATQMVVDVAGYIIGNSAAPASGDGCPADPVPPPPPPTSPTTVTRTPGQYTVNGTIPAGRYKMANAKDGCYWERQSGLSGDLDDVLANDFQDYDGPAIVDVDPTDVGFYFEDECGSATTWAAPATPLTAIPAGTYVVGSDIVAGTYMANAMEDCYWERRTSFAGDEDSIIDNDDTDMAGPTYVTINPTDVGFYTTGECGVWTRVS